MPLSEKLILKDVKVPISNGKTHAIYKLLINSQVMEQIIQLPESIRPKIKQFLSNLSSGEWETWNSNTIPEFISFKEREGNQELFTLYVPEIKACLIWKRLWSVDLLGRIEYPTGTYSDETSISKLYAPHLVISLLDREKPLSFKFVYDGINYEQHSDLNQSQGFWQIEPQDQLDYSEELYLLGQNVIDDLLNGIQQGLPLQMSDEQVEVLQISGPVLVSGEAGSGKTIIITHWLMINHLRHTQTKSYPPPISQLFVTFSDRLRNNAKKNFLTMLPKNYSNHNTHFLTYRDLIKEIAKEGGIFHQFPKEKEMTFEKFMKEYAKKYITQKIDPVLLWDEIRSVIKGKSAESQSFIDLPTYEQLSEKREQCKTPKRIRKDYYDAAQKYQNYLLEHGFWDGLDLVKACIPHLNVAKKYDKIACDEVQDLAPIEIKFLVRLIQNGDISNLFLTGDVAQVINPSGFQWNQVKRILGEECPGEMIPEVRYLEKNYRSCEEIVELVNSVLTVRRDILDDQVSRLHQRPLVKSRFLPMILSGKQDELLEILNNTESDPDKRLILVKTLEEKNKLIKNLGKAKNYNSILTIEEAKGLEYEGSFLWNFFIPRHPEITKNDWEKVFIPKKREKIKEEIQKGWNPYGLTYEFNLLHVGLTRSRYCLFTFDEEKHQHMMLPLLGEEVVTRVTRGDLNIFKTNWATPRPSGDALFNAGRRLIERDTEQAHRFFKLAAKTYAEQDNFIRAAECQEYAENYDDAAELYKTANDKENELRVLGIKEKKQGNFKEAGNIFMKLGELQINSGERLKASQSFEEAKESYYKEKATQLAADAAFRSAECLPEEEHVNKAIKFRGAVDYFKENNDIESAIRAQENAISEAKEAQRCGINRIQNEHIDAWISRRNFEIAEYEESRNNFSEGASAAMKSANLLKELIESKEFEIVPNKERYIKERTEALTLSIKLYIKSNQISKATNSQKELLSIFSPKGNIILIQEKWISFADLYFENQEFDQYSETLLELSDVLQNRKQFGTALTELKNGMVKLQSLKKIPRKPLIKLIEEVIKIAKANNEWDDISFAHEIYGNICEQEFKYAEAWNHYKEVGKSFIMDGKILKAEKNWKHGIEILTKVANPVEIGKNCFFEIVLDGYTRDPELYEYAIQWIKKSAIYFVQDFDLSTNLLKSYLESDTLEELDGYTKKLNEAQDPALKKELRSKLVTIWETRGWIETCIGLVFIEHSNITNDESEKNKGNDWLKKALPSFEKAKNHHAKGFIERNISNKK